MKHRLSHILQTGGVALIMALSLALSAAASQGASIGVSATVAEPLGIAEITAIPGSLIFAPAFSTALVFLENNGIKYSTSIRADSSGFVAFDYLSSFEPPRTVNSKPKTELQSFVRSQMKASILTVILTEN